MLRQKTLLGETYVELTQGDRSGPKLPEGGTLPKAQVQPSVQLDEIFRTFDAKTRAAFQTWMQQLADRERGPGRDLSAAIANLEPFAEDANKVLRVLDTQQGAVQQFVRNTGVVFSALSERQGQLQGLIRNSGTVFHTTAVRNQDLEATFKALPTFLDESRLTLNSLHELLAQCEPADHPAPSVGEGVELGPEADRQGRSRLQGLLHRAAEDRETRQHRSAGAPAAARQRSAAPAARVRPLHAADHADRRRDRPLPARPHRLPRQRHRHDGGPDEHRGRRSVALHPQLGAALPEDLGMFGPTP